MSLTFLLWSIIILCLVGYGFIIMHLVLEFFIRKISELITRLILNSYIEFLGGFKFRQGYITLYVESARLKLVKASKVGKGASSYDSESFNTKKTLQHPIEAVANEKAAVYLGSYTYSRYLLNGKKTMFILGTNSYVGKITCIKFEFNVILDDVKGLIIELKDSTKVFVETKKKALDIVSNKVNDKLDVEFLNENRIKVLND